MDAVRCESCELGIAAASSPCTPSRSRRGSCSSLLLVVQPPPLFPLQLRTTVWAETNYLTTCIQRLEWKLNQPLDSNNSSASAVSDHATPSNHDPALLNEEEIIHGLLLTAASHVVELTSCLSEESAALRNVSFFSVSPHKR